MDSRRITVEENVITGLKAAHERLSERFEGVDDVTLDAIHEAAVDTLSLDEQELRDLAARFDTAEDDPLLVAARSTPGGTNIRAEEMEGHVRAAVAGFDEFAGEHGLHRLYSVVAERNLKLRLARQALERDETLTLGDAFNSEEQVRAAGVLSAVILEAQYAQFKRGKQ